MTGILAPHFLRGWRRRRKRKRGEDIGEEMGGGYGGFDYAGLGLEGIETDYSEW